MWSCGLAYTHKLFSLDTLLSGAVITDLRLTMLSAYRLLKCPYDSEMTGPTRMN